MSIKAEPLHATRTAEPEEIVLARRCADGDDRAMRAVFEAHQPRLTAFAIRLIGNRQDAEEVVVSTFIRFWKHAGNYRGECSLRAFLTRICLNLARDHLRKSDPFPCGIELPDDPPWSAAPEDERMERIRQAMGWLAHDDRALLTLYYLNEAGYDEMCDVLGIKYEVLRTRLVRARKRLRASLGVEDDGR